jgi:hypothetical protein
MLCRGHYKETVGLLNVNSIHLKTRFTFNNPTYFFVWARPNIEEGV